MKKLAVIILLLFILGRCNSTHKCIDKTHKVCDGLCECDGMECNWKIYSGD